MEAKMLINQHIQECANNYKELSQKVEPMARWHEARVKREERWTRIMDKLTENVLDRLVVFVLLVLALATASSPPIGKLISSALEQLAK